jgi:hypothetical protein
MTAVSAVPRTRGGISGFLLILLGAWGAIIPFVGPYFGYAYTPDTAWTYTNGRLWLSILPGAAVFLGGIMVVLAASRPAAMFGGLVALLGGVWFVVGAPILAVAVGTTGPDGPGTPVADPGAAFSAPVMRLLEGLGFYYGLGVVIVIFAAFALGRFAVWAVRPGHHAMPPTRPPDETEPVYPHERNRGGVPPGPRDR